jgi:hypothetical protein
MILPFDDEFGTRRFEFCFVGFVLGGSLQEKKGMTVLRAEVAIFEKLEAISEAMPCGKKLVNGEPQRQLRADGTSPQLQISVQEYDLLYSYIACVPWQTGSPARHAVEVLDWLERIHRESLK